MIAWGDERKQNKDRARVQRKRKKEEKDVLATWLDR